MNDFFSHFDWKEIGITTMVLFAIIDIVGSIPIIIKIKKDVGEINPLRATLIALAILVMFHFTGESILKFMHVDPKAFAVAGSFILFGLAFEMIFGVKIGKDDDAVDPKLASVVPIAFPLIAGAGSMTSLVSLRAEYHSINILIAIVLNMVVVYAVLKLTRKIESVLGKGGIAILEKIFGVILLAIAIKLFTNNIKELF